MPSTIDIATPPEWLGRLPTSGLRSSWPLALVALIWLAAPAGSAVIKVGGGGTAGGCDAGTIAAALLQAAVSAGADDIRLARDLAYTNQHVHLTDWDDEGPGPLTIRGGYDDCGDTLPDGRTVVAGQSGHPVFEIDASPGRRSEIRLDNLELTGSGVRGLTASDGSPVSLYNVLVRANGGGGIAVTSQAELRIDIDSVVRQNTTGGLSSGGGIFCADDAIVSVSAKVSENRATYGGGIAATTGCRVELFDGAWIVGNSADYGGGIYLAGGGRVESSGGDFRGVLIDGNGASQDGGGLYLSGTSSSANLGQVRITFNSAGSRGGGVAVVSGASLRMHRHSAKLFCLVPVRCSYLAGNRLTGGSMGAAAYFDAGTFGELSRTHVEGNSGTGGGGSTFFVEGTGSFFELLDTMVFRNLSETIVRAQSNAAVEARRVSIAANEGPSAPPRAFEAFNGATVLATSSILWDTGGSASATGGSVTANCVLADQLTGFATSFRSQVIADPGFRDLANGDLHLAPSSPAIDYCDTTTGFDIDLEGRGWDAPWRPNAYGTTDAGADELVALFADGFESGDTTQWSSVVP